jgi:hypothetical protein
MEEWADRTSTCLGCTPGFPSAPIPLVEAPGHARDALKATGCRAGHTCRISNRLSTSSRRVPEAVGSARGGSTAASCGASHCGARLGAMKAAAFAIAQESRTARRDIGRHAE